MATASVTIERTSLGLSALVIGGEAPAGDGFFLEFGGVDEPTFEPRYTYAPDSAYVPGRQLLAAVLDQSTLPLKVIAQSSTTAGVAVLRQELEAAVSQFAYDVTLTVDGVARTWAADFAWPSWGPVENALVSVFVARGSVVLPVNPVGA